MNLTDTANEFLTEHHTGVMTTFRKNGGVQMSIVICGLFRDGVAFTTTAGRAKYLNLKRNPRCSLMVAQSDWWGYVVLEGNAEILEAQNTDAEELRLALRDVYRVAQGKEHPDWDEYDEAMVNDRRVAIIVRPLSVYGTKT